MDKKLLSSKEIALLLNISLATVNYYTTLGLLCSEERRGNMRLYDRESVLRDFTRIKELRKEGYSLKLISQRLNSAQGQGGRYV